MSADRDIGDEGEVDMGFRDQNYISRYDMIYQTTIFMVNAKVNKNRGYPPV